MTDTTAGQAERGLWTDERIEAELRRIGDNMRLYIADAATVAEQVRDDMAQALAAKDARIASQDERINRFVELVDQLERQLAERDASFDLRWNADMQAIQRWQTETGEELKWPNHVDLCVWLMQQLAAKDARIEWLEQANRDLRMELSAYQAAYNRTLPSGGTRQRRKPTND